MSLSAVEAFLEACGTRIPPSIEVAQPGRGVIVRQRLPLPFALIGRDERADLRLDGKEVSHRHAYLQLVGGRWWWADLDSRTGTHRARGVTAAMPHLDRQGVRIGSYLVRLAEASPSDEELPIGSASVVAVNPLTTASDDPSLLPRVALDFSGGTEGHRTWRMDRVVAFIGRSPLCKVRLHSPMVSRTHCVLVNTSYGLWMVDLLAREGTYVNGVSVRWSRLGPEDEVQIDQFRIRVRYLTPPPRRPAATPHVQPANEAHGLAPRTNEPWARSATGKIPPVDVIAPVEFAAPINGSDKLLMPLVQQFSLMQQQMFDQFQNTLLMMAQMFGNLQREQMTLIRQELEQIQELTRQLHDLQSDAERPASAPKEEAPPVSADSVPASPVPSAEPTPAAAKPEHPPIPPRFAEGDVHAWLTQRLAALHEERQSRWQKVLSLLTGR